MPEVEVIAHVVVNRRRAPATTSNSSLQGSTRLILKGDLFPTQRGKWRRGLRHLSVAHFKILEALATPWECYSKKCWALGRFANFMAGAFAVNSLNSMN